MLSEEEIKQIFFYCDNKNPNGFYADNVDIMEFANKVAAVAMIDGDRKERQHCIEFVRTLNVEVARALEEKRKGL